MKRFAFLLVLLSASLLGQTPTPSPANAWMKTPTTLPSADDVPAPLRHDRDSFLDAPFRKGHPLTSDNGSATVVSEGPHSPTDPEIPTFPNRAVVIGTFKTSRSLLSASGLSVYTEVQFQVDTVFDKGPALVLSGTTVTVALAGGTVRKSDGQIISFLTQPRAYSIQPNGTYLAILNYKNNGQFYTLDKTWDLSDGITRPNSSLEKDRADRGQSTLVGLSKDQLIQLFTNKPLTGK